MNIKKLNKKRKKIKKSYVLNTINLEVGDIILVDGEKIIGNKTKKLSKIIKDKLNSKTSHAIIYLGNMAGEAVLEGVIISNISKLAVSSKDALIVKRHKKITKQHKQLIQLHMNDQIYKPYSKKGAFLTLKGKNTKNSMKDKFFCSMLVANLYEKIGLKLDENIESVNTHLKHLEKCKNLETVKIDLIPYNQNRFPNDEWIKKVNKIKRSTQKDLKAILENITPGKEMIEINDWFLKVIFDTELDQKISDIYLKNNYKNIFTLEKNGCDYLYDKEEAKKYFKELSFESNTNYDLELINNFLSQLNNYHITLYIYKSISKGQCKSHKYFQNMFKERLNDIKLSLDILSGLYFKSEIKDFKISETILDFEQDLTEYLSIMKCCYTNDSIVKLLIDSKFAHLLTIVTGKTEDEIEHLHYLESLENLKLSYKKIDPNVETFVI